jgi:hypothetical protein
MGIALSACAAVAFGDDRVSIKGFYREDGTYVKPRVVDPIERTPETLPALPADRALRRAVLQDYYCGKVLKAKVSFPACHAGLLLYPDDLGKTNVDLFRKVSKYGSSIEKDSNAVITGIRISPRVVDIELNNGGYGSAGDVGARVLKGVFTLGITELMGHRTARFQKGSRLRIMAQPGNRSGFSPGDAGPEEFQTILKSDGKANQPLLAALGLTKDQLDLLTEKKLLSGLNALLSMPDLREKANLEELHLSKRAGRLLRKAASGKKKLGDKEIRALNKELLCAMYPTGIRKSRGEFDADDLDFKKMNNYLSLVFYPPQEAVKAVSPEAKSNAQ